MHDMREGFLRVIPDAMAVWVGPGWLTSRSERGRGDGDHSEHLCITMGLQEEAGLWEETSTKRREPEPVMRTQPSYSIFNDNYNLAATIHY